MTVYTSNIVIHTHTDFEQTFVFEDTDSNSALNLSGYTGCAKIKKYESSSPAGTFDVAASPSPTITGGLSVRLLIPTVRFTALVTGTRAETSK